MSAQSRAADLPDFARPPVTEVVLSIQFAPLQNLRNIHGGLFLSTVAAKYPKTHEHGVLPPVFEVFGPSPALMPQFEFVTGAPLTRYWFECADGSELLQVQPDRLIRNWRKQQIEDVYPRYESLRAAFLDDLGAFQRYLAEGTLGEIRPNQCEVSYINHIELPDSADPRQDANRVLSFLDSAKKESPLADLEDVGLQLRYLLKQDGKHVGRLYVQASPAVRASDRKPLLQLTLTARGKPRDETIAAAFDFLDFARDVIVRGFKDLTTSELHTIWGLKNAK